MKRWIRAIVDPLIFRQLLLVFSQRGVLRHVANSLLGRIGFAVLELDSYSSIDKSTQSVLSGPVRSVIFGPKEEGETAKRRDSTFPSINARHFESGLINCTSSAVIHRGKVFIPDYYFEHRERVLCTGGHLKYTNDKLGLIDKRSRNSLPNGIAIMGLGSFNWYHWLIEILPTAMLSARLPPPFHDYPLLVPDDYARYASFQDSLELFRSGRSVVELDKSSNYSVRDLIVIDSPAHGPFNLEPGLWPGIDDYQLNADVLLEFRSRILSSLSISVTQPTERLFLGRKGDRRTYNQDELLEISARLGFKVVYPEILSFREQVQLFHSARCIVGASGAAWANMLFCQSDTRGLTWVFPEYRGFSAYSSLAGIIGMDLSYLFAPASEMLRETGAAYDMGYHVSPMSFTQALESMLGHIQLSNESPASAMNTRNPPGPLR